MRTVIAIALAGVILGACAGPAPVLYPNAHYLRVGESRADSDIAACRDMAEAAGAGPHSDDAGVAGSTVRGGATGAATGALGGAIAGDAGRGAAVGAAVGATVGFLGGLFRPRYLSSVHMRFVERCLRDRGYDVVGWD